MLKPHSESGHCVPGSFPLHWRLPGEDLDLWEGMGQESQGYGEGGDKLWTSGGARDGTGEEASTQRAVVLRLVANLIMSELFLSPGCPPPPPAHTNTFCFPPPFFSCSLATALLLLVNLGLCHLLGTEVCFVLLVG